LCARQGVAGDVTTTTQASPQAGDRPVSSGRLPSEPVDKLTKPFTQFLQIESAASAILLLCAVVALVLSNTALSSRFLSLWEIHAGIRLDHIELLRSLKQWINDGLMTLFFFVGALELKREIVLGELSNPRIAMLSLAAALGGMIVPAMLFYLLDGSGAGSHGWGAVMATDTALLIGCLAILGSRVPQSLRLFLLSLAIFDDIGAILVVAFGYGGTIHWSALCWVALGVLIVAGMARAGIRGFPIYFLVGGGIWVALDASGIHPTVAGLILGLMTPARSWVSDNRLHAILGRVLAYPRGDHWSGDTPDRKDLQRAAVATREALSPVERLEIALHPWVAFTIMPLFALANAGLNISLGDTNRSVFMAIFVGLVVGKPIGVVFFSFMAVTFRLAERPKELSWSILAAGALLTGIGFTMALLIAALAFGPDLINPAKLGILAASAVSATTGLIALTWLTSPHRQRIDVMPAA
jgi:NhaA family Na+:H+ antiporter